MSDGFMFIPYKPEGDPYPVIDWEDVPYSYVSNFPEFDVNPWLTSGGCFGYTTYGFHVKHIPSDDKQEIIDILLRWAYEHLRRVSLQSKIVMCQLPTVNRYDDDSVEDYSVYLKMRYGLRKRTSIDE